MATGIVYGPPGPIGLTGSTGGNITIQAGTGSGVSTGGQITFGPTGQVTKTDDRGIMEKAGDTSFEIFTEILERVKYMLESGQDIGEIAQLLSSLDLIPGNKVIRKELDGEVKLAIDRHKTREIVED